MTALLRRTRAPLALTLVTLALASCKGDSITDPGGESEVISRVTLSLTAASGAVTSA